MPSLETPRLSFLNIEPNSFAFDRLAKEVKNIDQYHNFIQDLNPINLDPSLGYAGNNYLHISARYPQVFKLILDKCPKDALATELGKENYFGENVLSFACVNTESLIYALNALTKHLRSTSIEQKQISYTISKLLLSPTAYSKSLFQTACILENASALEYLLSLYSARMQTKIIQKLSQTKVVTGKDQTYLEVAMQNDALKAIFDHYLPQSSSSPYFFADIPVSPNDDEQPFSPVFI